MRNTTELLRISVIDDQLPIVKLSGQADFHNKHLISDVFDNLIVSGKVAVKADLVDLDYIDSSGISALLRCATKANECGGYVEIVNVSEKVSRALILSGGAAFFKSSSMLVPVSSSENDLETLDSNFWYVCSFSLAAAPEAAAIARQRISDVIDAIGLSRSHGQDLMIAFGEAITNAIKHGCKCDRNKRVSVKCVVGPGRIVIDIHDPGDGFNPDNIPLPSTATLVEGGMGIYVMRELMDEVDFNFWNGTTVRMVKKLQVDLQLLSKEQFAYSSNMMNDDR